MTSSMVFEVTKLRLHTETHTGEDKHKGRHFIIKGTGQHKRRQQGCPIVKRRVMATKDNGRNHNNQKENSRGKQHIGGDQKKHDKRERSSPGIGEERWSNLGRRRNHLHGWKDLCTKQQENQEDNSKGKS